MSEQIPNSEMIVTLSLTSQDIETREHYTKQINQLGVCNETVVL